ncbi:Transcriptional regulator OS=Streptomyces paromomycinus OX=92743 GN=GKJPGBOP_01743 PE=4 SV=1 [Streptomyces rimosus subsp. rimosus]
MSDRPIDMGIWSAIRATTRRLASVREAALCGERTATAPRAVICESWRRALGSGVDPDRDRRERPLTVEELEHRRHSSQLASLLPLFNSGLLPAVDAAQQIMVVADGEGRVLWREGCAAVRRMADRHGFDKGADWTEDVVGTNAIGTALVARRPSWCTPPSTSYAPTTSGRAPPRRSTTRATGGCWASWTSAARRTPSTPRSCRWSPRWPGSRRASCASGTTARWTGCGRAPPPYWPGSAGRHWPDKDGWTAAVTGLAPPDRVALPQVPRGRAAVAAALRHVHAGAAARRLADAASARHRRRARPTGAVDLGGRRQAGSGSPARRAAGRTS